MIKQGLKFLYKLLFDIIYWCYFNLIYAGRKKFDICSGIIGVSSDHFFGDAGEKICDEKISNILTFWCSNVIVTICCYMVFIKMPQFCIKRINNYRKSSTYLKAKQTREAKSQLLKFANDVIRITNIAALPDAAKVSEI